MDFPARINQYITSKKNISRRQADKFIIEKRVKINEKIAVLGEKINEDDEVKIDGDSLKDVQKKFVYLAFNKPVGIVSNIAHRGQKGINDILDYPVQIFPVGRLDKNSHGLIILTNDSHITEKLLHPKHKHEKEYVVKTSKVVTQEFLEKMSQGVVIDGYKTKKCKVKKINPKQFRIILTEGKKRQIRKMCSVLGHKVLDLERVRIMDIKLANLKPGEYRELRNTELEKFLKNLKIA
ncbi:MAG: pseudouridine synthase [Patescibacteria group bacterium]|nr:pseudouridine synthase [Patescibacteria group bacterium]